MQVYAFCTTLRYTGNRQANRLRRLYLEAILRQDVSFFDTQSTTGGLLQARAVAVALAWEQSSNDTWCCSLSCKPTDGVVFFLAGTRPLPPISLPQ